MVADAYDAVSAVDGVTRAEIVLDDHHASREINGGGAAHAGFVGTFEGEAEAELDELRRDFLGKSVVARQGRGGPPPGGAGGGARRAPGATPRAAPPAAGPGPPRPR